MSQDDYNPVHTQLGFLTTNTNARSMGFGEIGVVSSQQYYETGLTHNPALLSRGEKVLGVNLSYMPWLRNLVNDMNFIDVGAFFAINKKNTLGISFRYFDMGAITYTDINGSLIGTYNPYEYYLNLGYARTLSDKFSVGIGGKYLVSDLTAGMYVGGEATKKLQTFAFDIGGDFRNNYPLTKKSNLRLDIGLSIINIGPKVSYSESKENKEFIPTTLYLGTMLSYDFKIDSINKISFDFGYQLQKLLVPSNPIYKPVFGPDGKPVIDKGYDNDVSMFQGMIQSFYDAPGGFKEEWHELIHKIGFEASYTLINKIILSLRVGRSMEHETKGHHKYFTLGQGISIYGFYFDFAYILAESNNPYDKQTCFNIGFRTNDLKNTFKNTMK
ncbi:MAG: type IX secretion system outer membrane channel protein PorV [Bacteroidales bacterium]|nr:type IX secretion system outer membrane channel protein PorV [Bacteroidales bacterium]